MGTIGETSKSIFEILLIDWFSELTRTLSGGATAANSTDSVMSVLSSVLSIISSSLLAVSNLNPPTSLVEGGDRHPSRVNDSHVPPAISSCRSDYPSRTLIVSSSSYSP